MAVLVATLIDQAQLLSDKRNDSQLAPADWLTMVNWAVKSLWRLICSIDPDAYFSQFDFSLTGGAGGSVFDLTSVQVPCLPTATLAKYISPVAVAANGTTDSIVGATLGLSAAPFLATDVGCQVVIAGTVSNNGTFTIASILSSVSVTLSGSHTNETFPAAATFTIRRFVGAQFRALHGLDFNPDTTQRRTVPRLNFQERNRGAVGRWLPTVLCNDRSYDIRGYILTLTPYELAGGPYRVYYRFAPYLFTSPTDTVALDGQLEPYDEYLSVMTGMRALGIEESDQGPLAQRLGELGQEIISEHSRDDEAPSVIADVEGDGNTRDWR